MCGVVKRKKRGRRAERKSLRKYSPSSEGEEGPKKTEKIEREPKFNRHLHTNIEVILDRRKNTRAE